MTAFMGSNVVETDKELLGRDEIYLRKHFSVRFNGLLEFKIFTHYFTADYWG